MFEEGQSLCSKKDIPCVRRKTFLVFEDDETPIFGRTYLRKGVSEAKFDAEADFEVHSAAAPRKPCQIEENLNIFRQKTFLTSKTETRGIARNAF